MTRPICCSPFFISMEHRYKNFSLKPIVEEINGIVYTEEWRKLSHQFKISTFGRIKTVSRVNKCNGRFRPEIIRKVSLSGKYLRFTVDGKTTSIHRLVCKTFHDNPENKPQVNHLDGIKWNNFYLNVEWATQPENIQHAQSIGLMKYAKIKPPKKKRGRVAGFVGTSKKIIDINTCITYNSASELSKLIGKPIKDIRRMLSGERINHTQYRYITKDGIKTDVRLPTPKKPVILKPPKVVKEPKRYIYHPLPTKKMIMLDLNGQQLQVFASVRKAAEFMQSKKRTFIKQVKTSPNNYYKGFVFKFAS